jgi:hypothetical protein
MNQATQETLQMADEIALKPKVSCPECQELHPEHKISSHIERHRPFNPPGLGTSVCPKGCGRNLIKSDLKEHVSLCDGSLPLPSKKVLGSVAPAVLEPPPVIMKKEEPVPGKLKVKCPLCPKLLKSGKALGGHMTAHNKKRAKKPAIKTAQKAVKPAPRPAKKAGKRVASPRLRPGGILPPPPARATTSAKPRSAGASLLKAASSAGTSLREAASLKRAEAREKLTQATELENLADRVDKLL